MLAERYPVADDRLAREEWPERTIIQAVYNGETRRGTCFGSGLAESPTKMRGREEEREREYRSQTCGERGWRGVGQGRRGLWVLWVLLVRCVMYVKFVALMLPAHVDSFQGGRGAMSNRFD